jgi:hypothetical protein
MHNRCPEGVRNGKAQNEHKFSGLPPKADLTDGPLFRSREQRREDRTPLFGQPLAKAATNAAATAEANPEKLTLREAELLAEVPAAYPTLSRDEALRQLRAAGM